MQGNVEQSPTCSSGAQALMSCSSSLHIGCPPSLEELYCLRCLRKANSIMKDSTHPGHGHFRLLPSGKRYGVYPASTNRLRDSFYPRAIKTLNTAAGKGRGQQATHGNHTVNCELLHTIIYCTYNPASEKVECAIQPRAISYNMFTLTFLNHRTENQTYSSYMP